ncbi:MAG TPA: hypothetical protein VGK39_04215 [Cyclobacteriaceae bacterium]
MKKSILIFLLLGQFACNTEGHRGTSNSIQDSKNRETFIAAFELESTDDNIKTITKDQIEEVFIEYGWFVRPDKSIIDTSSFNIGIKLRNKNQDVLGGQFAQYQIGLDSGSLITYHSFFTNHSSDGLTLLISNPVPDTIPFKFYKGDTVVGDLLFIKK